MLLQTIDNLLILLQGLITYCLSPYGMGHHIACGTGNTPSPGVVAVRQGTPASGSGCGVAGPRLAGHTHSSPAGWPMGGGGQNGGIKNSILSSTVYDKFKKGF